MKGTMKPTLVAVAAALLLAARPAYAYLDPAAGSVMLQLLLGGVAAFAVARKLFWHSILRALHLRTEAEDDEK